jgi:levansucrase
VTSAISQWTLAHVAAIAGQSIARAPVIRLADLPRPVPGLDLWDHWPVQNPDGRPADISGGTLVMALSAPAAGDPADRHARARIRLLHAHATGWRDLGPLLPPSLSPGSREWSGSAVLRGTRLTLYFTAVGIRGEGVPSFGQRLCETSATLETDGEICLSGWEPPSEIVVADGIIYMRDMAGGGGLGTIKAFRDPGFFHDPAGDGDVLVFTASLAGSSSPWNGAIGMSCRTDAGWQLLPPLLSADGVNNELERPHIVMHQGRYHLFWSTQETVFAPAARGAPTGLYGMAAETLAGPWTPLNGSGLVFANPVEAPHQAYSWLVLPDLTVQGFADMVALPRSPATPAEARDHFGGAPTPPLRLWIEGDRAGLV